MKFLSLFLVAFFSISLHATEYPKGLFSSFPELCKVPLSDEKGIVLNARKLSIPGVPLAYNPSIVKVKNGYLVAFRRDFLRKGRNITSKIGFLHFTKNFRRKGSVTYFRSKSRNCEDPRLFFHNKRLFVFYTHVDSWGPPDYTCHLDMCELDPTTLRPRRERHLRNEKNRPQEKNWTPFSYTGDEAEQGIYFVYQFNPLTIFQAAPSGEIKEPFSAKAREKQYLSWEKKWGALRGTTPAVRIGDEYLTFFHSVLVSKGIRWYLIGALTLNTSPPFLIKKISPYPILYKGQYFSPTPLPKRVNFPCGFAEGTRKKREVFYLVCGENDSSIKLITIDKKRLLGSLKTIKTKPTARP